MLEIPGYTREELLALRATSVSQIACRTCFELQSKLEKQTNTYGPLFLAWFRSIVAVDRDDNDPQTRVRDMDLLFLYRMLCHHGLAQEVRLMNEAQQEVRKFIHRLEQVVTSPAQCPTDEIKVICDFCWALYQETFAEEWSSFRRYAQAA